jgi:hypothetical protein
MQSIYADGIANIRLIDGVIRLDLVSIQELGQDGSKLQLVGTLALSLQGLLRTHQQLGEVIAKLAEQGLIQKTSPAISVPAPPQNPSGS